MAVSVQGRDRVASLSGADTAVSVESGPTPLLCAGVDFSGGATDGGMSVEVTNGSLSAVAVLWVAGRSVGPRASASGSSTSAPGNAVSVVVPVVPSAVAAGAGPVSGRTWTGAPGPSRVSSTAARTGRPAPSGATAGPRTTARSVPAPSSSWAASGDPSPGGGTAETTMVSGAAEVGSRFPGRVEPDFTSAVPLPSRTPGVPLPSRTSAVPLPSRASAVPLPSRTPAASSPSRTSPVLSNDPVVLSFGGAVVVSTAGSVAGAGSAVPVTTAVVSMAGAVAGLTAGAESPSPECGVTPVPVGPAACEVFCGESSAAVGEPSTGATPSGVRVPWGDVVEGAVPPPAAGTPPGRAPPPVLDAAEFVGLPPVATGALFPGAGSVAVPSFCPAASSEDPWVPPSREPLPCPAASSRDSWVLASLVPSFRWDSWTSFRGGPWASLPGVSWTSFCGGVTAEFAGTSTATFSGAPDTAPCSSATSSNGASGPWSTTGSAWPPAGRAVVSPGAVTGLLPEVPGVPTAVGPFPGVAVSAVTGAAPTVIGGSTETCVPKPSSARRTSSVSTWVAGLFPAGTTRTSGNCDRLPCSPSRTPISALLGGWAPRSAARSRSACSRTSAEPWWTCCHSSFWAAVTGSAPGEYGGGSRVV